MKNELEAVFTKLATVTPEQEDYTGEDGLLYCGKCRTPKEAYHTEETRALTGYDKRPSECDCQRAKRLEREAAEQRRKHLQTVDELKQKGFTDPKMRKWTFENDNGRNPQMDKARFYADNWEAMQDENIGYLFWGSVGTGKSYLAACIANALMEQEIPVRMTNFAAVLNDLNSRIEGRNEYISRLCRYPLLIIDDFGMERGTEYGLEQAAGNVLPRLRIGRELPQGKRRAENGQAENADGRKGAPMNESRNNEPRRPDCVTEVRMGNTVLVVSGYFKKDAAATAADKMMKVLEAEAAANTRTASAS